MTHIFKVGDKGKTLNNLPYRILATDIKNPQPVAVALSINHKEILTHYNLDGTFFLDHSNSKFDLLPPETNIDPNND